MEFFPVEVTGKCIFGVDSKQWRKNDKMSGSTPLGACGFKRCLASFKGLAAWLKPCAFKTIHAKSFSASCEALRQSAASSKIGFLASLRLQENLNKTQETP
jgi:hypothetical protein